MPPATTGDGDLISGRSPSAFHSNVHLSEQAQSLLVAACLVQGVADADALAVFSSHLGVPARFQGVTARSGGRSWTRRPTWAC